MMSGGVTCALDASKLDECAAAIDAYAEWYERDPRLQLRRVARAGERR